MQIFLDNIVFTIQKAGGVSAYWYELLSRICNNNWSISILNAQPGSENIFEQKIDYSKFQCICESRIPKRYLRYLPLRYKLPFAAVFHGGYLRISPQKNILNILTVHDFAHERKLVTAFPRSLVNTIQKAYGIRRADGIICISESTRKELLQFYPATDPAKLQVIHHGISNDFYPLDKDKLPHCSLPLHLEEKYILYVGARKKYKNFSVALEVMKQLPAKYTLVAAGGEPWSEKEINNLNNNIPGRYHIFPIVGAADLNVLYNYAFCLLYTSAYEGFGFPPGEAMKAGCPVVATNLTAMPEIVGKAGLLANQADAASFLEKISLLENDSCKQLLIMKGIQQAKLFTWEKSIQETIGFYQKCWNNKFLK
ncbi:mannosyltransferase [Chitinophaga niastensis]|uniref:Mannosyltransferase n=1 Tax=Chitinophaga niastensis TaxID=536980 RepID=A0A2P8HM76_CHINA|nr:glycosyltransferase family 1 protein [Chitinophaga niastensis]PSL47316.1 mannosyltransferase [Chitinophaga niastensis]